jgi:hypothetical protein
MRPSRENEEEHTNRILTSRCEDRGTLMESWEGADENGHADSYLSSSYQIFPNEVVWIPTKGKRCE